MGPGQQPWWGQWKDPKILIGVPTTGLVPTLFYTSSLDMVVWLMRDGVDATVHTVQGSLLSKSRNLCAEKALAEGWTHLLFIDSDQTFPPTTPNQLFSHRLPIVACNIATKKIPPQRTACLRPKDGVHTHARPPMRTVGLEKIWRVGCGVMLIETEVFRRIPRPWFHYSWDDTNGLTGEDWYFLEKAEAAGIPLYCDHDLSAQVGHLGGFNYRLPEYHIPIERELADVK
jgi:hypothetical protein